MSTLRTSWSRAKITPPPIEGCTMRGAINYNPLAVINNGSCIFLPPPVYGCTNPDASNYNPLANTDDGSCAFSNTNVTFDLANKKTIQTKIGANIFQKYDVPYLAAHTTEAVALALQVWYITFGSQNAANAATFNTFLTAAGGEKMVFLSINAPFSLNDWFVSTFSAVAAAAEQESELTSKGITNAQYTAWLQQVVARYPSLIIAEDAPNISSTATPKTSRLAALRPLTYTQYCRQYEQLCPDDMVFDATDNDYNLTLLNYYYNTLLPSYLTAFFTTSATRFPNVTQQIIEQWHNSDTGSQTLSDALASFSVGEIARVTLANTDRFKYLLWMRYMELVRPTPNAEYYGIKLIVPCFKFTYAMPVTLPFDGVTGLGFQTGANSWGLLINNQKATTHTIAAADIQITAKTVSGNFIRNTNYAASWGASLQQDTNVSAATITVKGYSTSVVTFTTV